MSIPFINPFNFFTYVSRSVHLVSALNAMIKPMLGACTYIPLAMRAASSAAAAESGWSAWGGATEPPRPPKPLSKSPNESAGLVVAMPTDSKKERTNYHMHRRMAGKECYMQSVELIDGIFPSAWKGICSQDVLSWKWSIVLI